MFTSLWQKIRIYVLVIIGFGAFLLAYEYLPIGLDWQNTYSKLTDHLTNLYEVEEFINPPWVIFFLPHAWFPLRLGNLVNAVLNILVLVLAIRRFGGQTRDYVHVLFSPLVLFALVQNNIDWIVLLGILLANKWSLPLVVLKPQTTIWMVFLWLKKKGLAILIPLLVVFASSLILWGVWFSPDLIVRAGNISKLGLNASPWPWGIPLGLFLFIRAWRRNDEILAYLSGPFLTPYFALYSVPAIMAVSCGRYRVQVFLFNVAAWGYLVKTMIGI
jgi:hypothetical protein